MICCISTGFHKFAQFGVHADERNTFIATLVRT